MGLVSKKEVTSVWVVFLVLAWGVLAGQHGYSVDRVIAAPGASPEMLRLQKAYLGTWEYTETYQKTPMVPNGGMNTGIYTSEPGPGGNSLINRFHSKGPVGDYEGLLIMTWDPKEKAYKAYVFGNDFPGGIIETGNFEGDALVFRGEITMGEAKVLMRNSTKFEDNGKLTADQFMSVGGAPEALFVRVAAKRKQ